MHRYKIFVSGVQAEFREAQKRHKEIMIYTKGRSGQ